MTDTLSEFFSWAVHDVIFFSGDVQTTTIAVAITSSLCCSIVVAVVHFIALIRPAADRVKAKRNFQRYELKASASSKKYFSPIWLSSNGRVQVPCVKCGSYYADEGCWFVTCRGCCFSTSQCPTHHKSCSGSQPCSTRQSQLDLSDTGLQSCPSRLGFVGAHLTFLNLNNNKLSVVPAEIGCLRGLQVLSLERNLISELPDTLASLTELQCLDIGHNQLKNIPASVWKLQCLQELHVSHNALEEIPAEISRLQQLLVLDVSYNNINSICDELYTLFQLKWLNTSGNKLVQLSEAIGHLVNLELLDISACDLHVLPRAVICCTKLTSLFCNTNRLSNLPSQIGLLPCLSRLEVMDNQLPHLPYTLTVLQSSLILKAQGNPLVQSVDYMVYRACPDKGGNCGLPSLKELTGREIIKRHIPFTSSLPSVLQDLLNQAGCCSECRAPVVEQFRSEIVLAEVNPYGCTVPLYKQTCALHSSGYT
ncbi:protein lap1-like [Dreissena polymorpha]|uniref:Disease resistance R13L4/SHOC-2-like LRR domain-containing protein n=1 Tax=Dreissena polymorpha TaxID=45954 RepID=A0A9D4R409_DREPO|nr:protein lap1-like [Dreissena polymorpha]XP_052269125.1 protein lap1-like [Dreissena polymorpha]XP_052269126.1 protein lap1-like [Dreissena polymorpha]XP_052269127.1 protein lap1-like [Dreissena polymorpha]KAH3854296.1 hypothetical protein DPMN_096833 [Dreissena polymorpha]